ncbi:uncharacterized protein LOC115443519 [Manduca sexta]|uniref:Uncharacterized protein n=1 Tax=Manduca sexta TaxID=7130 RepID=A0A922CLU1_MANSE|nr:uncharacterized protein LOC115443519 [Manduca sexta]KAG6450153.1 hypothetical protein O3G_MSEX006408 [Manduca sexta]
MSKAMAFVVVYSIFLLFLFCVMCYLMSTINPAPLTIVEQHKANGTRRFLDLNLKPLIVNNPATVDNVEYGLEKVRDDEYLSSRVYPLYLYSTARIEGFNGPDILETVQPPVWPVQTESRDIIHFPIIIMEENNTSMLQFETAPIKSYRRSVNSDPDDKKAIIFKVLHGNGGPRIEIKLDTNKNIERRKPNFKFAEPTPSDNDRGVEKPKLSDNKIIKMVSNDTIVIYGDGNPSETDQKDYVQDITSLNEKNKHKNTKQPIIDIKNKVQSITYRKPKKYALNVSLSDSGNVKIQNVTNGIRS